jgi:hypothetical protein
VQIRRRQLEPGETDHELLWLGVSTAGLVTAVLWFGLHLPWPGCVFHDWTGLPCLTCGATRSTIQFLHGNFFAAWHWNPLVALVLCAVLVYNAYACVVLIMRSRRLRLQLSVFEKQTLRIVIVSALALNWLHSLGHWRDF